MDEVKIWSVDGDSNVEPLASKGQTETESLLEETLVRNPDLLIPGLRLVGRQTPTEGGPLDLLGVDEDGRLVVFELKRGMLSRDAVAQVIDYASDLDSKSDVELADHIAANSGVGSIENIDDFEEWYGENTDAQSLDSLRPLRLFLIGLGADDRTERMVRFLADNSGMDISLLTFHGFKYDGKTLLARQVEVEGVADVDRRPQRRYLSVAETRERLARRIEESGVSELFDAVGDMFRENWHGLGEAINVGSLRFSLWEHAESKWLAYARIEPKQGTVQIIFYGRTLNLCPDEFALVKEVLQHDTWRGPSDSEGVYEEMQFPLTPAEWEVNKERLYTLTQAVYEAWESSGEEEQTP